MADCEDLDFTTTKRARLSSDCNCDQKDTPERALDIEEHHDSILTRHAETEEGVFNRTSPVQISSGEQHGGPASHERRESEDFPTCFSVEDDVDDIEEHRYQPIAGPMGWVQRQMTLGVNPEDILSYMVPHAQLPSSLDKTTLWKIIIDILTEPSPRHKLDHINSIDDVIELLRGSKNIVVLTGAGVSVSCGIPDFRSRDGIYARLSVEYPDLPDPQAMFDISYFYQNPRPFFKFAKEIYPGQFKPSLSHRFIRQLESNGQLLRNYSQNIDTLEQVAGITKIIQCHGSFSTASCTNCKYQVSSEAVREDIFNQVIPLCPKCKQDEGLAIMKPDIVFFGESLPSEFYHNLDEDSEKADLLIVIGSSLKVRPVALIPSHIPPEVPQILINREPLRHVTFDVELLGDCDVIVAELCRRLGGAWNSLLQGFEAPCVERRSSFPEMPEPGSSGGDLKLEESIRLENEQSPQTKPQEGKHTPVDSAQVTEEGACQSNTPSDTQQLSEEDGSRPSVAGSQSGHVTVGENSGSEETGDESHPDQPRACASTQDSTNSGEMLRFLFLPPSRYIFNGAEVMDSPLPSPSQSRTAYLDSSSDDSDSDSVGEIEDYKAISNQVDGAGGEIIRRSSGSSTNSDDGFGEGELETALEFSNAEATRQALSLILGELSSYTCESEENSRMSTSDDLLAAGAGVSDDSCHTSDATDTALASRPFSAVNMEMMVGREEQSEPKNPTQIECKKDCDSGCSHCCQDSTRSLSTVGLSEAVDDTLNSCCSDV